MQDGNQNIAASTKVVIEKPVSMEIIKPRKDTKGQVLNSAVRLCTNMISFNLYKEFIEKALCDTEREAIPEPFPHDFNNKSLKDKYYLKGIHSYELLKLTTEVFLLLYGCCDFKMKNIKVYEERKDRLLDELKEEVSKFETEEKKRLQDDTLTIQTIANFFTAYLGNPNQLPYIKKILENLGDDIKKTPFCKDGDVVNPTLCCIELLWSYWHEEAMLSQSINAIAIRFQNKKSLLKDPLANLTLAPLHSINNLLWGYIQDESHRLSLQRRAYEYDHEYGLTLIGKAIPTLQSVDSRANFLEAFNSLLNNTMNYYRQESNKMIEPDAFPLLNALKEVHLVLAEGAHNQFRDLPWTARVEMLIQQWLLARPEIKEFLGRRPMIPYSEEWMGPVDAMKSMQGWSNASTMQFHDLAVFGEQILLSIRYGDWTGITDEDEARNWALYWKNEIQSYVHAYRVVTGVDLANPVVKGKVDATKPSVLIRKQLMGNMSV